MTTTNSIALDTKNQKKSMKTNSIGLDAEKTEKIIGRLNTLLADYSFFYQNTRGYHWNIKGQQFFELHVKFEELYNDLFLKIDEIAERILTLGGTPQHNYSEYTKLSEITESKKVSDGIEAVEKIVSSLGVVIAVQREVLKLADDIQDEGTSALMSDYLRAQEKMVWMYSAYLKK